MFHLNAYHVQAFRSHFYLLCKPERGYCADTYGDSKERDVFSGGACDLLSLSHSLQPSRVYLSSAFVRLLPAGYPLQPVGAHDDWQRWLSLRARRNPNRLYVRLQLHSRSFSGAPATRQQRQHSANISQPPHSRRRLSASSSFSSVPAVSAAGAFSDPTLASDCIRPLTVHLRETLDCKTSESIHTFPQL